MKEDFPARFREFLEDSPELTIWGSLINYIYVTFEDEEERKFFKWFSTNFERKELVQRDRLITLFESQVDAWFEELRFSQIKDEE